MKKSVLFILTLLFIQAAGAEELLSLQAYLKSELATSQKVTKEAFVIDAKQKSAMLAIAPSATDEQFVFYYGKSATGTLEKLCLVLPQQGKEGQMSVGVCFDPKGLVTSVQILSSHEERGKKAQDQEFLKQFKGKRVSEAFQVGKDIDAVSGATWTSKAVTEAIRKASFAFQNFAKDKL